MHGGRDSTAKASWINFATHYQSHPLGGCLQERRIHFRTGAHVQAVVLDVTYDPYDLPRRGLVLMRSIIVMRLEIGD